MNDWPDTAAPRPLWLVTLADLALLLVGFFVLIQATRAQPSALAHSLRAGFATDEPALPVAAEGVMGFAPGSAVVPDGGAAITAWARGVLADPRVSLTVTGATDGTAADVDGVTGSASLLAADRARAVAAILAPLAPRRITVSTASARARGVTVTLAFTGDHQDKKP
ncbi:hypothetical protein [Sphingomonas sp. Leaf343]|uniref:hypothetical protein n=1 Tax=Sphingomonas sp. Leaf343 TaxID=1736345 RepID=UPI000A81A3B9|nr:hypothetical protein [Sphingomonas sp. Leaf343]